MRWLKWSLIITVLLAGALFWERESDFATTTRYCPWTHRIGFTPWVCKVKDVEGRKVLVEHAKLDVSRLELSIYEDGKTRWIQHPDGHVTNFSPALNENTIHFDHSNAAFLIVNGERFVISDLQSEQAYK